MGTINVAIVGAGQGASHGKVFAEMIDETEVAVVCDLNEERASACAEMLGVRYIATRFEDVLEDPDIDAVAIAIGCHLHAGAVIAALDAGKHVVVEVPAVATTIEDVWRMVHAAERGRLKLQMGNHERWTPQKRRMKEMIEAGEIGDVMWADGDYTHDGFRQTARGSRNYMGFDLELNRPLEDPPHWRLGEGYMPSTACAG